MPELEELMYIDYDTKSKSSTNADQDIKQQSQNVTLDHVLEILTKMLEFYKVYLDYSLKFAELKHKAASKHYDMTCSGKSFDYDMTTVD
jgi:hypothetical protein